MCNICVCSVQALVSVSTIGTQPEMSDEQLAEAVKAEMASLFGAYQTATWQLLRIYRIPFAQPNQVQLKPSVCVHLCTHDSLQSGNTLSYAIYCSCIHCLAR